MATAEYATGTEAGTQVVGNVVILYGNVKAISIDGTERLLGPNSPIFSYDRIITESDGRVAIIMDDPAQSQLDIGRMSHIIIDEDIFAGVTPEDVAAATAEIEQIQEALLAEDFDPTVELEAPAAGASPAAGGGHPVPDFARVTHEGEVIASHTETTGITTDTVDPIDGMAEPENDAPVGVDDAATTPEDTPVTIDLTSNDTDIDGTIDPTTVTITRGPDNGTLVNNGDGTVTYTPNADYNGPDSFTYTVQDDDGTTSNETAVTIGVDDINDAPEFLSGDDTSTTPPNDDSFSFDVAEGTTADTGIGTAPAFDIDGDTLTYSIETGNEAGLFSINSESGEITVNKTIDDAELGNYRLGIKVVDGQGGTDTASVEINLNNVNDPPVINENPEVSDLSLRVSEEGLDNGLIDDHPNAILDTTDSTMASGQIVFTDPDAGDAGNHLVTLSAPAEELSSGGTPIFWSGSNSNNLIGYAGEGGPEVISITIDNAGNYSVNLSGPIDHLETTYEDVKSFGVTVTVDDQNGGIDTAILTIGVEDDKPVVIDDYSSVTEGQTEGATNLMMIIDVSGSMGYSVNYNGSDMTRLAATKLAAIDLLNSYQDNGKTMVRLVQFSGDADGNDTGDATALGTGWVNVATAISLIEGLEYGNDSGTGQYTNYDAALDVAQSAFSDTGKIDGAQNVSYFMSDGVPTIGSGESGTGLNGGLGIGTGEETSWKTFLNNNNIISYAIGIGTGATESALNPVAWDGTTATEMDGIEVTEEAGLSDVLQTTVIVPPSIAGNVLDNDYAGADGWDTGTPILVSVSYNGITYEFTPSITSHELELGDDFGKVLIHSNGDYEFTASPVNVDNTITKDITYTIQDNDGDTTTGLLHLGITDSDVAAYDNFNQAMVSEVTLPGSTTTITLADFSDTTNSASSSPDYNPWIFDTKNSGSVPGDERTVVDGDSNILTNVATDLDKWIVSSVSGSGLNNIDASVNDYVNGGGNELKLRDYNGDSSGAAELLTPVFTVGSSGSTTLSFDYSKGEANSGDDVTWSLYKLGAGGWEAVSGAGYSGTFPNANTSGTVSTENLTPGDYRVYFSVIDGGGGSSSANDSRLYLDNIKLTITDPETTEVQATTVNGNVLTDPNNYIHSTDPWDAVDDTGADSTTLLVWNGLTYVEPDGTGTIINGLHGDLLIKSDGSYSYTPDADLDNVGEQEVFSYKLNQSDGDTDTAELVIRITDSPYTPHTPIIGTDGDDTALTGTSGDDVILGLDGNDHLHGGDGNDHLNGDSGEDILDGDAGNDVISGGTGNDTLSGGDGADTLWGGPGNDLLDGGAGDDTLTGNSGADTFKASGGNDTITDYNQAEGDVLDISDLLEAVDTLAVTENPDGSARLSILDGSNDVKGSVSFDNINFADLDPVGDPGLSDLNGDGDIDQLDSLIDKVDIDDGGI